MEEDFTRELEYLGFTMRLKRISDAMLQEGRRLYNTLGIDIEPNWFVIFKLLKKYPSLSVMEIADRIKLAHPSVITITNKMIKAGYVSSAKSDEDNRKRVLRLTEKARKKLPAYEEIWSAGSKGMEQALDSMNALEFIAELEDRFFERGFRERTLEQLKAQTKTN